MVREDKFSTSSLLSITAQDETALEWMKPTLKKVVPKKQAVKFDSFLDVALKPVERAAAQKLKAVKKTEEEEQVTQQSCLILALYEAMLMIVSG